MATTQSGWRMGALAGQRGARKRGQVQPAARSVPVPGFAIAGAGGGRALSSIMQNEPNCGGADVVVSAGMEKSYRKVSDYGRGKAKPIFQTTEDRGQTTACEGPAMGHGRRGAPNKANFGLEAGGSDARRLALHEIRITGHGWRTRGRWAIMPRLSVYWRNRDG